VPIRIVVEEHVAVATEIDDPAGNSREQDGTMLSVLICLFQQAQNLKNGTLPSTVLAKDEGDWGKLDAGAFAKRFEILDLDGLEHFFVLSDDACRIWSLISVVQF
jgi:hypothetical protein